MKSIILNIVTLLFSAGLSLAQNITFSDIKYVQEHNTQDCNSYLTKKGFTSKINSENVVHFDDNISFTQWGYPKSGLKNDNFMVFIEKYGNKANIGLVKPDDGLVGFTTMNKVLFNSIITHCIKIGYVLEEDSDGTSNLISKDKVYLIKFSYYPNEYGAYQLVYY